MSRSRGPKVLFIGGLSKITKARDIAYMFEQCGPVERCDIPTPNGHSAGYAFIKFVDSRDAADAYHRMHNRVVQGRTISVEWAKHAPEFGIFDKDRMARLPPRRYYRDYEPRYNDRRGRSPERRSERRDYRDNNNNNNSDDRNYNNNNNNNNSPNQKDRRDNNSPNSNENNRDYTPEERREYSPERDSRRNHSPSPPNDQNED